MNVVALLSEHLLTTLRAVLRGEHRVVAPPALAELAAAVRAADADVLVVEPGTVPTPQWPHLVDLVQSAGTPTVVIYTTMTPPAMRATVELARLGIRHIVLKGYDDTPRHLRALFDALAAEFWTSALHARLAPRLCDAPPGIRDAVAFLFRSPDRVRDVPQLATIAGVAPRTLRRWLERAGIASAKRLILAARVEWAHALLRGGQLPVHEVARRLGYPTPRHFRRETQRLTALPPAALGRKVAGDAVVALLEERVMAG
jgi:AraC-like DNA-binding protein